MCVGDHQVELGKGFFVMFLELPLKVRIMSRGRRPGGRLLQWLKIEEKGGFVLACEI